MCRSGCGLPCRFRNDHGIPRLDAGVIELGIGELDRVLREGGGRCALRCDEFCPAAVQLVRECTACARDGVLRERCRRIARIVHSQGGKCAVGVLHRAARARDRVLRYMRRERCAVLGGSFL